MKTLEIHPLDGPVDGEVRVPGSKSYTNRALLIAALCDGQTTIDAALFSDDTHHMAESLKQLGIVVGSDPKNERFIVTGCGGRIPADRGDLYTGNSGTTTRFLTALLGLGQGKYVIDGNERMRERPLKDLIDGLTPLGVEISSANGDGCPPITIRAKGLTGGRTFMPGDKSSQYFTALMLVGAYAEADTEIRVRGELLSKPYIDMTTDIMSRFGIDVERDGYNMFRIRSGQRYRAQPYTVEPDATNATYFFAAAAVTSGRVLVRNLSLESAQGDVKFVHVLEKMGCDVSATEEGIVVQGPEILSGIDIDMNGMPDAAQTLAAIAPFSDSPVTIRNVPNMRIKETDRIDAMAAELTKLGVKVDVWADGLRIHPTEVFVPAALDTYDDHRMAMSLSLIGLRADGVVINDPDCVNKTFPAFFETLAKIRPE
jgi:3-phosphoshikimate 1-carboxyvinyltransferase